MQRDTEQSVPWLYLYLHRAVLGPDSQDRALLDPRYAGHWLVIQIEELGDGLSLCIPQIDCRAQGHGQQVVGGPVEQIQIWTKEGNILFNNMGGGG